MEREAPSELVRDRGQGRGACEHGIGATVGCARRTTCDTMDVITASMSNRDTRGEGGEWRNELPVQISGDKDRYAGPDERLMSRSVEHHGGAKPALRVADMVKVSVD
jgi:hypothetical protein